jgi:hypothetical protein
MKYESPITCHSKDIANVKVFADRQTDRQTDRRTGQKLYAPDLSKRGHKKDNMQFHFQLYICEICIDVESTCIDVWVNIQNSCVNFSVNMMLFNAKQ